MSEHLYDVASAAHSFGVSPDSIRRRLRAGELRGARRASDSPNAPWLIPHSALLAAGFEPKEHPGQDGGTTDQRLAVAEARVEELRVLAKSQSDQLHTMRAVVEELARALAGAHRGTS